MRISGCVIARNEKDNIANCINNLKCVTDEIIVVDTGSEDNTVQIAEELGAIVYKHKWNDDFSKAKNTALDHAKGDWIIFLDADEYFHKDSIPKIRPLLQSIHANRNVEGVICEIVNIDKDTKRTISNDEIIRIYRNSKKIRYINRIHEEIRKNGALMQCINTRDVLSIIHTGYSDSLLIDKVKRNLELIKNNAEDEKSAYYFATSYFILQNYEDAYKYADLALSVDAITERDSLAYKMHLIRISVTLRIEYSNKEKIQRLIDEANRKYENHPEIAKIEATYLFSERLYGKALEKYLYALNCHEKYGKAFEQNDFEGSINEVYFNIAQILYLMNREADALEYYVKVLQSNKYYSNAFNSMFALCRALPEKDTIALINSIYDVDKEDDVEFIIARIADCGRSIIILYYANKWNNIFEKEDDVLIYALAAQGKYSDALEIALLYFESDNDKYVPLVTAVILLGQLFPEGGKIKDIIGAEYFNIISCYAEDRKYSGNMEVFINVFSKLVKYSNQFNIDSYLNLGTETDAKILHNIAKLFLADYQFGRAIDYFSLVFEMPSDEDMKAEAAFNAGYCFYKLKQYQESVRWFEKATVNGYSENDLVEYLKWIGNKATGDEVK